MRRNVYVVHCIDSEGPLYESLGATFQRIKEIFNIEMRPTKKNLEKLQQKKEIFKVFHPVFLNYNDDWNKIDKMLEIALSEKYRHVPLLTYSSSVSKIRLSVLILLQ